MRIFAAVPVPDEIQDRIAALQAELKSVPADVKWVARGTFHLTMKFFGDVEEEQLVRLTATLRQAVNGIGPLPVSVATVGAFPHLFAPKNIWVGVEDPGRLLPRLAGTIETAACAAGFAPERRPFAGHITIGRLRSHKNVAALTQRIISLQKSTFGSFEARTVDLVRSVLYPAGPEYTCLNSMDL